MNGRIRRPGRGPVPWGLVGFLLMAAGVEAALTHHDLNFTDAYLSCWSESRTPRLRDELRRAEVICLGDSQIKDGLAPLVLEQRLGRRAYNGGVIASSPPMTYFILRQAVRDGARPAAVIVDFSPHILSGEPLESSQWNESGRLGELLELAWAGRAPGFLVKTAVIRQLHSYRRRLPIRKRLYAELRGERPQIPDEDLLAQWRNWNVNRGAFLLSYRLDTTRLTVPPGIVPTPWSPNRVNALYLRKLFDLAAAHEIPVYWMLAPVAPHVQAAYDRAGLDAAHARFVRNTAARAPGVVVLDARWSGYTPAAFGDAIHLNVFGANAFSLDVADVLRDRLAGRPGPNWVAMPTYSERPIEAPLEDIGQSWMTRRGIPLPVRR